jgi:hypothetical protein
LLTTPIQKIPGIRPKINLSTLISFGPEKQVGLKILGDSALIFLCLSVLPEINYPEHYFKYLYFIKIIALKKINSKV